MNGALGECPAGAASIKIFGMQMGIAAIQVRAGGMAGSTLAQFSKGFLRESRISVQIIFLMRFSTAALLTAPALGGRFFAAALAWALATVAAYVFNGVMDVTEDRANGSTRPIASGSLPVRVAAVGVVASAMLSLAIGGLADPSGLLSLLLLTHLGCGYAYSGAPCYGKRRGSTAALLVLGMGALTYTAGWLVADRHSTLPVLLGVAMSLWMAGVGALAKDLSDIEGDAVGGRRTPVIVWGDLRVRVVVGVNAIAIAVGYVAIASISAPILLPSAVVLCVGATGVSALAIGTRKARSRAGRRLPYRAFMVTQYAVHIAVIGTLLIAA